MTKKQTYGNDSIASLKGADRVRKRPAVIFGSDGLEGCEHAVFEILSNAIDEAREGHGDTIIVTQYLDHSIEVEDFGRGCPVDWNESEGRYNWELVFCELYAGGKYQNNAGGDYEYSLGLNGLGACATQYASRYFDAVIRRDGFRYDLHFERGELVGKMQKAPTDRKKTGSLFRWLPDLDVFTDIAIPTEFFEDTLKRQAVVNAGVTFRFRREIAPGKFDTRDFLYEKGILDYVTELTEAGAMTMPQYWEAERKGRDREDKPEYKVKLSAAVCFSNQVSRIEYYHNSSWLEHGGAPEKAVKNAFVYAIDAYLKANNKIRPGGDDGVFPFPSPGLLHRKRRRGGQNRRAGAVEQAKPRDSGEDPPQHQEEALRHHRPLQPRAEVRGLPQQGREQAGDLHRRGRQRSRLGQAEPRRGVPGHHAHPRQNSQLPQGRLRPDL